MLQIFLDKDDLNSGLYEGTVRGRRLFTSSAVPHGPGTIFYFNNDKFHRVNYTGQWVEGTRQGNGSSYFKDGSVYRGEYRDGVEAGEGTIRYPNGNVLEGEFIEGKIHGHAVFKYPNGDQREGFFSENVLDGQVIYTRANGQIVIELWKNGERLPDRQVVVQESSQSEEATNGSPLLTSTTSTSTIPPPASKSSSQPLDLSDIRQTIRSGDRFQLKSREPKKEARMDVEALRKETDESNRDFLFKVFQRVNGS